jgi:glycerol-3-phosphate O-acyltransferase
MIGGVPFSPERPLSDEPLWPADAPTEGPVVVVMDASSRLEAAILSGWANRQRPIGVSLDLIRLAPSRRRKPGQHTDPRLESRLRRGDNPFVLPVRVVWSPPRRTGTDAHRRRNTSWLDVLRLGDPRDPDALRQRVIVERWPDRLTVLTGPGAAVDRLLTDFAAADELVGFTDFVTRRAWLALERAERSVRGNRYKVPKFIHQEIWSKSAWRDGAVRFGVGRGLSQPAALARAHHYLEEMAANHSPFLIDLIANAIHWLYKQGYGGIIYDRKQVAELNALGQEVPLAFLPSHRSNLDRLALQFLKWENDLPPNHTAGGINMNFFPIGPLIRRTGVFFIRRSFKDNELYKFVLQSYLDYLVENRFPLEWYMEGGRSRSGKLLPPRFGLLAYVVDSWRRNKAEDVMLIPVSIAYDQIQDLGSYTSEATGGAKDKESLSWVLSAIRSLRRRYGNIHVRFGEPISVAKAMAGAAGSETNPVGADDVDSGHDLELAKVAFEVMYRIGQVTPITPAAVVSIALLEAGGSARTINELAGTCAALDGFIEERQLPTTEQLSLEDPSEVRRVIDLLAEHGNVATFNGTRPVYYLKPDQALRAAYYRNVVVHHFVPRGVVELALGLIGPGAVGKIEEDLWRAVDSIRDLLKFEFFFPEKDRLRSAIRSDLDGSVPGWTRMTATTILSRLNPPIAPWAIVPFLESYLVVADALAEPGLDREFNEKEFISKAMKLGEEYRLMGTVAADSVSTVAFRQALALARNRGLLERGPVAVSARAEFADEVRRVIEARSRRGATK